MGNSSPPPDSQVEQMLLLNEQQRHFYETKSGARGNFATRLWSRARGRMMQLRKDLEVTQTVWRLHTQWLGDLEGKRVLDLGCGAGNRLSLKIASQAGFYLGIDLSESAVNKLQEKLRGHDPSKARAEARDFLSSDFPYEPFDIIYAYSVLHHFEHFESFLRLLRERMKPGGRVISIDPMQTSPGVWIARKLYRPFQSDASWEWPFTRKSFRHLERHFHIEAVQGIMGYAKWALPVTWLPFGARAALALGRPLHARDLKVANRPSRALWRCLQVAICLRRRD